MAKRDLLREADLKAREERLAEELAEALANAEAASLAYKPWLAAFLEADLALRERWALRQGALDPLHAVPKKTMLAAYNWRTVASGDRGPFKKAVEEAAAWVKRVRMELEMVQKELGT